MSKLKDIILILLNKNILFFMPNKMYLKLRYHIEMGTKLNLRNPSTFNEKLQWLKLNNKKDMYTTMVDKYDVKSYVSNIIGEEYIIPTLGIYNKFEDIVFEELPNRFVIKCTHDSGGVVVVNDKNKLNIKMARKKINKSLNRNYYYLGREWPYKNIKPRIIIEKYLQDYSGELIDYKIYAFDGKCDYVMVCFDRQKGNTKFIYFDRNWKMKKDFSKDGIKYGDKINLTKPKMLDIMFKHAEKLSKGIPFVRVDFYEANGKLYFGELTFYPSSGFDNTRTNSVEKYLNDNLILKGVK